MSIKLIDNAYEVYIIKDKIRDIDFNSKDKLECYLKGLFKVLKEIYNIELIGFYNVDIYIDKNYGIVIRIEKEELDYYNYYKNQIDMKISIVESSFLYEVFDIPKFLRKEKIHIIDNNMYLELNSEIDNKDMMYLVEYSNSILYNYSK